MLGGFPFARYAVVSDPAAIRQVLIEDNSAYRKSTIERRVLASRMPNGLVTVDGEQWQRDAHAGPLVWAEDDRWVWFGNEARRRCPCGALAEPPERQRRRDQG